MGNSASENSQNKIAEEVSRVVELAKELQDSASSLIAKASSEEAALRLRVVALDSNIQKLRSSIDSAVKKSTLDRKEADKGYAYILTHPGIPSVFYDHFYDWGDSIHNQIMKLMEIRRCQDLCSRSSIRILEAQPNLYSAIIGEKLCMKLGDGSWCPAGREWKLATSGHRYAIWLK